MITLQTDVLIVGAGLAGLTAASRLVEPRTRVCIASTGAGASPFVHGLNAPLEPEDSPSLFYQDTRRSGYYENDPALVKALCDDSLDVFAELEQMGMVFDHNSDGSYALLRPLGASCPRVACAGNDTGPRIMAALTKRLREREETRFADSLRVLRLRTRDGRVCGALGFDEATQSFVEIYARAVLLACGGICRIYPFSTNKRDGGGDGAAMAYLAGAPMVDMEFIQFEPSGAVWPEALQGTSVITTMYYEGAVLRNALGQRFLLDHSPDGERVDKDVQARLIAREMQQGRGTPHGGVYFDATGVGREKLQAAYPAYVERYQRQGIDLATEMVEIAPAPHTSLGGVMVDPQGQTARPGLFAAGEAMGGLHGANRIGGNAGLETLVFGRRAGEAIAAYLAATPQDHSQQEEGLERERSDVGKPSDLSAIQSDFQQWMEKAAYVLRDGDTLQKAAEALSAMQTELESAPMGEKPPEVYRRMRLANDITAGLLVVSGALARGESLGCHVRTDGKAPPPMPYRVIQQPGRAPEKVACPAEAEENI